MENLIARHECGVTPRPDLGDFVVSYHTHKNLLWWAACHHEDDARQLEAVMRSFIVKEGSDCHPPGVQWCAHCCEADIGFLQDEPIELDDMGSPIGIWKRYTAGLRSLIQRANINLNITDLGAPQECSHYGDTDQRFRFTIGEAPGTYGKLPLVRYAALEGELVLHRTVGRRTEWRIEMGWLTVWSRQDGSESVFSFDQGMGVLFANQDEKLIIERITGELAARSLEASFNLENR